MMINDVDDDQEVEEANKNPTEVRVFIMILRHFLSKKKKKTKKEK